MTAPKQPYTVVDEHIAVVVIPSSFSHGAGSGAPITHNHLTTITNAIQAVVADDRIVAAVVVGDGCDGVFCPGYALDDSYIPCDEDITSEPLYALTSALEASPKPFIAVLNGTVSDVGVAIALACHYRVAVEGCTAITSTATSLGLTPIGGISLRLPRCVGLKTAFEILCLGVHQDTKACISTGLATFTIPKESSAQYYALSAAKVVEKAAVAARMSKRLPIQSKNTSHQQLSKIVKFQFDSLKAVLHSRDPITASSSARPSEVPPSLQTLTLLANSISSDPTPINLLTGTPSSVKRLLENEVRVFNKVVTSVDGVAANLHHMHTIIKNNAAQHSSSPTAIQRFASTATAVLADGTDDTSITRAFDICSQLLRRTSCPEIVLVVVGGGNEKALSASSAAVQGRLPKATQTCLEGSADRFQIQSYPPAGISRPLGLVYAPSAVMNQAAKLYKPAGTVVIQLAGSSLPDARATAAVYGSIGSGTPAPLKGLPVVEVAFTRPTHRVESFTAIQMVVGCGPIVDVKLVGGVDNVLRNPAPSNAPIHRLLRFGAAAGVGPVAAQLLLRTFASAMALIYEGSLPRDVDVAMRRFGCKIGPFALMDKIGLRNVLSAIEGTTTTTSEDGKEGGYDIWAPLRAVVADKSLGKWFSHPSKATPTTSSSSPATTVTPSSSPLQAIPAAEQPPIYRWAPERVLVSVSLGAGIKRRYHFPIEIRQRIMFSVINEAALLLSISESTPQLHTSTLFPYELTNAHPRQHFTIYSESDVDLLSVLGGACGGFPAHMGGIMYWAGRVLKDGRGRGSAKVKAAMEKLTTTERTTPTMATIAAANRNLEGYDLITNRLGLYNLAFLTTARTCKESELCVQQSCPAPTPLLQKLAATHLQHQQ